MKSNYAKFFNIIVTEIKHSAFWGTPGIHFTSMQPLVVDHLIIIVDSSKAHIPSCIKDPHGAACVKHKYTCTVTKKTFIQMDYVNNTKIQKYFRIPKQ